MSLTKIFVARPTLVFVLVSLMLFAGIVSLSTIVKQLFPNVSQPTVTIGVTYNGASVTEMRDNIVAPIEQNLAGTTDLQTFNSTVQQGQATISATFLITSDIATDLALTQKAVQASEKQLPTNLTPPTVSIRDPSESTVVTLPRPAFDETHARPTLALHRQRHRPAPRTDRGHLVRDGRRRRHPRVRSHRRSGEARRVESHDQRRHQYRLDR